MIRKLSLNAVRAPCSCIAITLLLAGCTGLLGGEDGRGPSLAELPDASLPDAKAPVAVPDLAQVQAGYERALASATDPKLRQQIKLRLADLEMMRSENAQLDAQEVRQFYAKPIALYRELLAAQEADPSLTTVASDQLRYKLAKALSLEGRTAEAGAVLDQLAQSAPDSRFIAETQFRRAEQAFSAGDYRAAEAAYASVSTRGDSESLRQNALYMSGWAQFKRGDYERALQSFAGVLDQLLGSQGEAGQMDGALQDLGAAKANLVGDTLRVMALALANLQGADSIAALEDSLGGKRPYEYLLYQHLGQLYLEQKRYTDAAASYQHFVAHNPDSNFAPSFSMRVVEVYQQGNFPSLVVPAKQDYVHRYGIRSSYWTQRQGVLEPGALAYLKQSLDDLATYEQSEAQRLKVASQAAAARASYGRAANWYREFVQTFERDPRLAEMSFLLAECLNEAGDLPGAMDFYEQVAYSYRDPVRGADAGYSAVLVPQQLIRAAQQFPDARLQEWRERKIDNALRFAEVYRNDPRALTVLADAGAELLQQQRYREAQVVAERVLAAQPAAPADLQFSSLLILGHSRFETGDFAGAELAYTQVLAQLPTHRQQPGATNAAPAAKELRERIAASIFRQAEASLVLGDKLAAVNQLLRVTQVTPEAEIAIKAQYDAGRYLMDLENWSKAETVYVDFRRRYPRDPLTASLPAKMVTIYQGQQKWEAAAEELQLLAAGSADPELKRQSVYLAAELYAKSGRRAQAIEQYRRYASEYPRPLDSALEAQYQLTQLYEAAGDSAKRRYWLEQLVATNKAAGAAKTERSIYLAASAQTELAQASYDNFLGIKLKLPLKASLKAKRAAMALALGEQEQILSYGLADFTTQASYKIGAIYAQLGRDLLDSQRPAGLDDLALEQYDILLEEQADPFQLKAIEIHERNAQRAAQGTYDAWVKRSFAALAELLPARYNKRENRLEVSREIN